MAKRRKKAAHRSTTAAPRTKRIKTRSRRRKSKGFLSDFSLSNPAMTGAVKSSFSGALGGITAGLIQRMTANQSPGMQIAALGIGSVVASWGLKAPNFGAGMAGAAGILIANEVGLLAEPVDREMRKINWANNIQRLPMFLNENGEMLAEENNYTPGYSTPMGGY